MSYFNHELQACGGSFERLVPNGKCRKSSKECSGSFMWRCFHEDVREGVKSMEKALCDG